MKSHRSLKAAVLAATIEYHWSRILYYRRRANTLLAGGASLNSNRILRLNQRLMRHSLVTMKKEAYYETHFVPPIRSNL